MAFPDTPRIDAHDKVSGGAIFGTGVTCPSNKAAFIGMPDLTFNNAGVKGLGEVSMTGVAPAIANAVFHASGHRLRQLPIRIEHLV